MHSFSSIMGPILDYYLVKDQNIKLPENLFIIHIVKKILSPSLSQQFYLLLRAEITIARMSIRVWYPDFI